MRRKSTTLTEQELEIMKVVWERDSVTVRDVYEALLERRKVAYTTVMTMMKILEQKKYLKKTQVDRAYVYRPAQPKRQVIGDMVRDFVNRVFNGSAEPLLVHLVEEHDLSRAGTGRDRQTAEEVVMSHLLIWNNLVTYSLQIGLLVGLAAFRARAVAPPPARRKAGLLANSAGRLPAAPAGATVEAAGRRATVQVSTTVRVIQLRAVPADPLRAVGANRAAASWRPVSLVRLGWLAIGLPAPAGNTACMPAPLACPASGCPTLLSDDISSPVTFGFRKPVILLPARFPALDARHAGRHPVPRTPARGAARLARSP